MDAEKEKRIREKGWVTGSTWDFLGYRPKVLLTGGSGLIGQAVLKKLVKLDVDVTAVTHKAPVECVKTIKCNLTKKHDVKDIFRKSSFDIIFHLAGNPYVKEWGPETSKVNFLSTHNLLHYCGPCRFVYASSATVYGDKIGYEDMSFSPSSAYGAAKAASEILLEAFTWKDITPMILRPVATIGPKARHGLIPDVVRKLKSNNEYLELFGDEPGSRKPFVHVNDVADGFIHFAFSSIYKNIYNLSNEDILSVKDVAELVMEVLKIKKPIKWLGDKVVWQGDNNYVNVSSQRARRNGWKPQYTSAAAVKEVAKCTSF
jgi:UDP-glucose 4-epimerase